MGKPPTQSAAAPTISQRQPENTPVNSVSENHNSLSTTNAFSEVEQNNTENNQILGESGDKVSRIEQNHTEDDDTEMSEIIPRLNNSLNAKNNTESLMSEIIPMAAVSTPDTNSSQNLDQVDQDDLITDMDPSGDNVKDIKLNNNIEMDSSELSKIEEMPSSPVEKDISSTSELKNSPNDLEPNMSNTCESMDSEEMSEVIPLMAC